MKDNDKTYAIISIKEIEKIDFTEIKETSKDTIRKSLDNTQFVIKWEDGYTPTFITDISVVSVGTYDHHAILELMSTPQWSQPIEEIV